MPYSVEFVTGANLYHSDLVSCRSLRSLADALAAREWLFYRSSGRGGARVGLVLPGWPSPDEAVERALWSGANRALDRHVAEWRAKRPALMETEAPAPSWVSVDVAFVSDADAARLSERQVGLSAGSLRNVRDRSLELLELHLEQVDSIKSLAARSFALALRSFCPTGGAERLIANVLRSLLRPAQWSEPDAFWARKLALQRSGQLAGILAAETAPAAAREAVNAAGRSILEASESAASRAEGELRLGSELFAMANQLGFSRLESAYLAVLAA